jgi:predicted transcriptional regulator
MTVTEILQLADKLLFAKQGKHLDDLQVSIIKGLCKDQTYQEIAQECNRSESRVRNIASKLLQLLSEELGENIEKTNFRSAFKRLQIASSPSAQVVCINHNFSLHSQTFNQSNNSREIDINKNQSKSMYHDLTLAPQIIKFYNRETELKTLGDWIFNQNIRLISVLGLSGIGKTTLVKRFIDLNVEQFEIIIWKSLKYPQSLDLLLNDFLHICQQEPANTIQAKLQQLFTILSEKKCLIILDDLQNIFANGELAGKYDIPYQDYQNFFTMLTTTEHHSNIILISQEKCAEMQCLDQQLYPLKSLELLGLDDSSILDNTGLNNPDSWSKLIQLYEGNPNYLKNIVNLIKDIYDSEVTDFLVENNLIITQNLQYHFQYIFNRLSPIEQQILLELSKLDQPISREDLKSNLALSSVDFVKGLQSLQQRYIITKIKEDKILFKLSPVFREYMINSYKDLS